MKASTMGAALPRRAPTLLLLLCCATSCSLHLPALATRRSLPALGRTGAVTALAPGAGPSLGSTLSLANIAAADRLTDEAARAAAGDLGWWGTYIKTVEDLIFTLHDNLEAAGVPFPYGVTIFCFILAVKVVTLPLNWQQLSASAGMKSMKPQQDIIRKWYGDNSDLLNLEIGMLFEKFNVNPLAGCLPSLAQIPVFLGVYYSVTSIARAKIFDEGFFWIPNLSGPIADRTQGLSWLTENWSNGAPALGWADTLCYLTIPAILVVTQTVSLRLLGSFEALEEAQDSTSQNVGIVLRILPFMLGWFAMNAPAGLGLYWVCNNILTTTQTVAIKKIVEKPEIEVKVDLARLGPRRDPLPLQDTTTVPDWVKGQKKPTGDDKSEGDDDAPADEQEGSKDEKVETVV
jgi:YidC/Oxa1 family membrane protein insertase